MGYPFIRRDDFDYEGVATWAQSETEFKFTVYHLTAMEAADIHGHLKSELQFKCDLAGAQRGGNTNAG